MRRTGILVGGLMLACGGAGEPSGARESLTREDAGGGGSVAAMGGQAGAGEGGEAGALGMQDAGPAGGSAGRLVALDSGAAGSAGEGGAGGLGGAGEGGEGGWQWSEGGEGGEAGSAASGGSAGAAPECPGLQAYCHGACSDPKPHNGCGADDCLPCPEPPETNDAALVVPACSVSATDAVCAFVCLADPSSSQCKWLHP